MECVSDPTVRVGGKGGVGLAFEHPLFVLFARAGCQFVPDTINSPSQDSPGRPREAGLRQYSTALDAFIAIEDAILEELFEDSSLQVS